VSRRFVAATETALGELLGAELSGLELVALMVDGVHFADHLCVVALGIDIAGTKHPLALAEGSSENTTLFRELLVGLRDRGWTPPARCSPCWTGPRRSPPGCEGCLTARSSPAANSTRS